MMLLLIHLFLFCDIINSNINTNSDTPKGEIIINVGNIDESVGWVRLGLYNNEKNFLKDKGHIAGQSVPVSANKTATFQLKDIPVGKYAVAIYHDVNNNRKFDTNVLGIPQEPYAFSNNIRVKWRPPAYSQVTFELKVNQKKLEINLQRW